MIRTDRRRTAFAAGAGLVATVVTLSASLTSIHSGPDQPAVASPLITLALVTGLVATLVERSCSGLARPLADVFARK